MMCNWESLLSILPRWMWHEVDNLGREELQELRLRTGAGPELVLGNESIWLAKPVRKEDLLYCIQAASRFSPWTAESMKDGYLTAPGGHRIGICGLGFCREGRPGGIREITSVCIRVARDYPGIAGKLDTGGSVLILGAPGWGKTTLLRDLSRSRAEGMTVAVVDRRGELFPGGFRRGKRMDVLTAMPLREGILQVLRTMGPDCIAVDEITDPGDCEALRRAAGCGVALLATAHAGSVEEFHSRAVYRPLAQQGLFDTCLILARDKSCRMERMRP